MSRLTAFFSVVALVAGITTVGAQGGAPRLTVTVRDNDGVLPAAVVTASPRGGVGRVAQASTDDRGVASFVDLPAGTYDLRVSFPGFADVDSVTTLDATGTRNLEITLRLVRLTDQTTVTTANRREQMLSDIADSTVVLDSASIADTGSRTAKDLLYEQTAAGVQVNAGGGQGHISINGIPNSGVLVLVDGRRYLGKDANGSFNMEDLLLSGVERVEVVRGAGSALYGSDAIGGVVNFVTSKARGEGLHSTTDLSAGSYADWRVNQSVAWRGSRGGFRAGGGYRTYDGFDLSETNPQTIGQPESQWKTGEFSADFRVSNRVAVSLASDYSKRDITNYFFSGATQLASTVYDSQRELTRWSLAPSVDFHASSRTSFNVLYNAGRYDRDETRVFVVSGQVQPQAPWKEWNDELKLTGRHAFSGMGREHLFQAGYEHRSEKLRRGTLTVTDPERSIDVAWLQQEFVITPELRATAGVRFDSYSDFGNETSPKVSVVYAPGTKHRVRGSVGHGFRPPFFGELYLNTPPSFVGNPDLKPETANTMDIGYSYASPYAEFAVDYFNARVEDGIAFNLNVTPFTYGNLNTYTSKGTNVSVSVPLPGGFVPSMSYTFNTRVDLNGNEIGGYSRHAANLKLLWANPRLGLRANVRGQLLGQLPPGATGSYQPGYQVWNAQVSKQLGIRNGQALSAYVQVTNLNDARDIFLRNAQGEPVQDNYQVWIAPRTFQAGFTLDLDWTK